MANVSDAIFTGSLPAPFHERRQYLPQQSVYSRNELDAILSALGDKSFEPNNYPNIVIAQSGVPYLRSLDLEDGANCSILKLLMIDYSDCPDSVQSKIDNLKSHVQGVYGYGKAQSGFMRIKDFMKGNRDGPTTAFTTGLNLLNSWCVSPVAHSVEVEDGDNRVSQWVKAFHILLGDLAQYAMPAFTSAEYIDFCKTRKAIFNSPCFGSAYDTQAYFTSAQVNCSDGRTHVGGKAGGIHSDAQDCNAFYSMALNLSVVRPSSHLGYFWFPNLDLAIPIRPLQLVIFQGIEEHTGTPLYVDESDTSPLPFGYPNDVRFNVIAYPKSGIINGTSPKNLDGTLAAVPKANLYQHALPHFGGESNHQKWVKIEMAKSIVERTMNTLLIEGMELDTQAIYNAIKLPSHEESTQSQASTSTTEFCHKIEVERFKIRLKHVQAVIGKYLHKTFASKEAAILKDDMLLTEPSEPQGGEPVTYDSLATGLLFDDGHHTHEDSLETSGEGRDGMALIDPILQMADAEMAVLTNDVFDTSPDNLLPSGFVDAFKTHFAIDTLDDEIEAISFHTKVNTSLGKGIEKTIAMLPSLADLDNVNPTATTDICFIYGNAMGVFYNKINEANFITRGFRASFMKLFLEAFSMYNINRYNVWEIRNVSFKANSFGLKLRDMIDKAFTDWTNSPEVARTFEVSASQFFGSQYNPNIHLDVKLSEASNRSINLELNQDKTKAYIMLQAVWGLCMHQPISRFYNMFLHRSLTSIKTYKDRLGSSKNDQRSRMINRFRFFWIMVNHFNLDRLESTQNGLLMLDGFYNFSFGYNSRDFINLQHLSAFATVLDPTEEEERESKILRLASTYGKLFDSSSLLQHRGSRKLELSFQPHINTRAAQRPLAGRKRKTPAGLIGSGRSICVDHQLTFLPPLEPGSPAAQLDGYMLCLFQYLYQVAQVGKQIINMRTSMRMQNRDKTDLQDPIMKAISDMGLRKFMVSACNTVTNADKFISYRVRGPSFELIRTYYPTATSCREDLQKFLWHLLLWRLFGFGRLEVIRRLYQASTVDEGLTILYAIDNVLERPLTNINAYGNLHIPLESRPAILNRLYSLARILSQRLLGTAMTFAEVQNIIAKQEIPYMPPTGLVSWLVTCDLAEYNLSMLPTIGDLARKIGQLLFQSDGLGSTGGSGPWRALLIVQEECNVEMPFRTTAQLEVTLTRVFDALHHVVGKECREIQGRDLSVADIEHMLCKISRGATV